MKNQLDFLVIGVQKCATTWMYECLYEHPEICLPKHKREHEYIGGSLFNEKGIDWYFSLLNHCNEKKVRGDVSVEYIVNEGSPKLLYDINPDMKFIVSIRNPGDRALSAIKWYMRKGTLTDNMALIKDQLEQTIENFSLARYNMVQNMYDVLYRGFYDKLLNNYYQYYNKANFLIVRYEDIKSDAAKVLADVFSFLNVNPEFVPAAMFDKPKKNSNNKLLMKMERKFPTNKIVSVLVNKLHQQVRKKESVSSIETDLRNMLNDFYAAHHSLVGFTEYHTLNNNSL